MLLLTFTVGLLLWAASDQYQTNQLSSIFQDGLAERFKSEAKEHRVRFYRYLTSYHGAVRAYASNIDTYNYVNSDPWSADVNDEIVLHEKVPQWLPKLSIMRSYVWPHYAMLLNEKGKVKELYHYKNPMPPDGLLNITTHELELGLGQAHVTMFGEQPYVLSSEYIYKNNTGPILVIASPLNEEILKRALNGDSDESMVALLKDGKSTILVSSNAELIQKNASIESLEDYYLLTGAGHFDTGSSDQLLEFVSFMSTDGIAQQTSAVLMADRQVTTVTALLFVSAFALVIFWITSRLKRLTNRVVKFSEDMEITQPDLKKADEIDELEKRFELFASAIRQETTALEHQALHDSLTKMPNRKMFNNELQRELLESSQTSNHFIIMIIDLDRFKEINDTLGHHIGDVVLQIAAQRLQHALRDNDLVARLGGDEFGILLPNTCIKESTIIAEKIIEVFQKAFVVDDNNFEVSLSIGIAEFPKHGFDAIVLLQRADIAMYNAKHNRDGYSIYESSEDIHTISRLALMGELRQSMSNELLSVYYQPKISLLTGEICGAEALLRWEHPERGFISPEDFIPLAEQTGLIQTLTYWVIEQAAQQCALWRDKGYIISVSVNISVNCIHDVLLPERINAIISKYKLVPSQLVMELTENVFMKNPEVCKKVLNKMDEMGVEISIDDFGTGYSSLSYLKQLPIKEIKIDRSFVIDMLDDENNAVIVQTTTDLAHNLGIRVIAEGVENAEIEQKLQSMGCDAVQGYYYARPAEPGAFLELLESAEIRPRLVL
jgi:diguanylate cyclase (GGDEF)-like protein